MSTITNSIVGNLTVETTEVAGQEGRAHWIEQHFDAGRQTGITVRHPFDAEAGRYPKPCELHEAATFGDAVECAQTFGTDRHA